MWIYILKPQTTSLEEDLALKQIEIQCNQLQVLWDSLSDEQKKQFWEIGTQITTIPIGFSKSCNNLYDIPVYWGFNAP